MQTPFTYPNGYPASLKMTIVSKVTTACDVTSQEVAL